MADDPVRSVLLDLAVEQGRDWRDLSLAIGKNHAYIQQFIQRGSPRRLPEEVREALGRELGVHPDIFKTGDRALLGYSPESQLTPVPNLGAIPVLGEVAAGVWREAPVLEPDEHVHAIPDPRWPPDAQFALRVKGDSCDRFARDGDLVVAVHYMRALPPGDDGMAALVERAEAAGRDCMVVVERRRGELVEATLKALVRDGAGFALEARSHNPRWAGRLPLHDGDPDETTEIVVTGLVIARIEVTV